MIKKSFKTEEYVRMDNKLRTKEVGSFSIKYLKYLFLRDRKEQIPDLEEDFRKRRFFEDEFDDNGKVIVKPKELDESKNFNNLKNYTSKIAEEEKKEEEKLKDNSANRINKYRNQLDKYNEEDDENFNKEVNYISVPDLTSNYSNRNIKNILYEDEDDFLLEQMSKKSYPIIKTKKKYDYLSEDDYDDIDEDYLEKILNKKNTSESKRSVARDDIDDFLESI